MLHVIGQILVQIRQTIGIPGQLVVHCSQRVPRRHASKPHQIHHVQRTDVVRPTLQVVVPKSFAPKLVPQRFFSRRTKRSVRVWCSLQIHVPQFTQIRTHDLVGVDGDDFWDRQWKQHVQKQNLVPPDDPLLFSLTTQPSGPLVRHLWQCQWGRRKDGEEREREREREHTVSMASRGSP